MRRPMFRLRVRSLMLLIVAAAFALLGVRSWLDPFRGYPESEALDYQIWWHTAGYPPGHEGMLLQITTFPGGDPRTAEVRSVQQSGRIIGYTHLHSFSRRHHWGSRFTGRELRELRRVLGALPPSDDAPALGDLMIVSFNDSGTWRVRTFDRSLADPNVLLLDALTAPRPDAGWARRAAAEGGVGRVDGPDG